MTQDLSAFLHASWQTANAAGEIIRTNWQEPKDVDCKGAIDLVTDTDRQFERVIVETLISQFTGHAL